MWHFIPFIHSSLIPRAEGAASRAAAFVSRAAAFASRAAASRAAFSRAAPRAGPTLQPTTFRLLLSMQRYLASVWYGIFTSAVRNGA